LKISEKSVYRLIKKFDYGFLSEEETVELFQFIVDNDMTNEFGPINHAIVNWMLDCGLIKKSVPAT
jgi:hypothetical protein